MQRACSRGGSSEDKTEFVMKCFVLSDLCRGWLATISIRPVKNFYLIYMIHNIETLFGSTFKFNMFCLTINGQIKRRLHNVMFALWFNRIEIKLTQ